jgi:FtsH-binding integral membrane protein
VQTILFALAAIVGTTGAVLTGASTYSMRKAHAKREVRVHKGLFYGAITTLAVAIVLQFVHSTRSQELMSAIAWFNFALYVAILAATLVVRHTIKKSLKSS